MNPHLSRRECLALGAAGLAAVPAFAQKPAIKPLKVAAVMTEY